MPDTVTSAITDYYDRSVEHPLSSAMREGSLYYNYGYWHEGATSMFEASERLMAELTNRSEVSAGAKVLDVACGMGATTQYIAQHTPAERVVGINISEKQLEACREYAPNLEFRKMSATEMEFRDESFDNIFCIEAAFHFHTRQDFLNEARRVLKQGNRIAMTDIPKLNIGSNSIPENLIQSIEEYADLLVQTGFNPVSIIDRSEECLGGYVPFVHYFRDTMMERGQISRQQYNWLTWRANMISETNYLEIIADAV